MKYCIENIETLLANKINEAYLEFGSKELKIIDIGAFPWHKSIELSFLFTEHDPEDDIASWANYDYSGLTEGKWKEAEELASEMFSLFGDCNDGKGPFIDFAKAATSKKVKEIINQFNLSPDFTIQVLHPDDDGNGNYCELINQSEIK